MNILEQIVAYKRTEVEKKRSATPVAELEKTILFHCPVLSLKKALLDKTKTGIIAEFKRKSPSKGMINAAADIVAITSAYTAYGASALSVLTDSYFFGGSSEDLLKARANDIPILRKDFIIDEYQLIEAKSIGADAILLIAACLTPAEVKRLAGFARNLGLEVLLELHGEEELDHICDETELVGINNRNLKDFKVDLEHSFRMAEKIPAGKIRIAESGINAAETIRLFAAKGFNGFLIGEYFMKEPDPGMAFKQFVNNLKATKA